MTYRQDMRVPVRIFSSRDLLQEITRDKSLDQAVNAASLPGLVGKVVVMPDMHQGYGFPIGGVAATRYPEGVISPGAIGYDINCGVRLLSSQIPLEASRPHLNQLADALDRHCPSGVGRAGNLNLSESEVEDVCVQGSDWAKKNGYASEMDVRRTEDGGRIAGAKPEHVSPRAIKRGRNQVGTLGSGNHFIEIDQVVEIFDKKAAEVMGLRKDHLALQIHCGSRGFGHQVCSDYVRSLQGAVQRFGIQLPDRELVCAPMDSPEGESYLAAMRCAANYAFANRQVLTHFARIAFEEVLAGKVDSWHLFQVYDVAHNMGKIETHTVRGKPVKVCVHRKGATRAFGPGAQDLPGEYQAIGQPVLVPGSMGTYSWVLKGTEKSMERSWGSSCHGAGRTMSRSQAKKQVWGEDLRKELERQGIRIRAQSMAGLAEEAPEAYKDVNAVVDTVVQAGIAEKVALLKPLAVVKG
jgi:tRNA-splicing ligase RtcB